jgi:hypothetical protein
MNLPIQNSYLNGRAPDMLQTRGDILRDKMQQMFLATQGIQRISYSTAEQAVKTRFINNSFKTKWTEKEKEEMANDYKALIDSGMSPDSLRWAFNVAESSHVGFINAINRTFETMFGEDNLNIKTTSKDTDMGFFESIFRSPSLFKQSVIKQIYHLARDLHRNEMRKRDDFLGQYADIVKNLSKEEIKTLNSVRMNNDTLHREQYQHQQIGSNSFKVLTPDDIRISFSRGDNMDVGVLKSLINQDINFGTSKRVSYTQLISVLKSLGYTADKFVKTYSTAVGKESQTVQVYAYKGERKTYNTEQEARKVALEETKKYISDTHGDKIGKAYKELRDLYDNLHNITNLARKNAGLPDLGYIDGYFPHMFGSYAVLVKDNGVWESIRTFDTMYDAVDWVKHDSGFSDMQMKNMIVTPNTYDSSTTDVTFYTLNGDAISDAERLELGKFLNQDMREMISGEFKERFFGNTKRRYSNNDGWLKDVTDVDKRYINGLIRYNLHNDFRQRAINIYERQWGTGSFRDEATTPMQKWVKQYINDVDGKPTNKNDV